MLHNGGNIMLHNMLTKARRARKDEGGFTLIELLIVIVILGVLAGIVVFSVRGIQDRGEASACKSDVATTETAVEAYYAKTGGYPATLADLSAAPNQFLRTAPKYVKTADYTAATGAITTTCP